MKKLTLLLMMLGLAWNAWSQQQAEQAMDKLAFLVGNWQGTALANTGPGQQVDLQQHETVDTDSTERCCS